MNAPVHPIPRDALRFDFVEAFWKNTAPVGECLEWQKSCCGSGYGRTRIPKSRALFRAHRVAYFIATKKDPGEKLVLHRCDNRKCCYPPHLFLGTAEANAKDKVKKGRAYTGEQSGERNPNALLKDADAELIVQGIMGGLDNAEIRWRYGFPGPVISAIRRGDAWRKVSERLGYQP